MTSKCTQYSVCQFNAGRRILDHWLVVEDLGKLKIQVSERSLYVMLRYIYGLYSQCQHSVLVGTQSHVTVVYVVPIQVQILLFSKVYGPYYMKHITFFSILLRE